MFNNNGSYIKEFMDYFILVNYKLLMDRDNMDLLEHLCNIKVFINLLMLEENHIQVLKFMELMFMDRSK